jgi:hypothetical protein
VRCESCKDELLVAFSCKGRGVQWTLSFPHRVRWVLLKDAGLLSDVLTLFLRALLALQRRSALQVTPHFHSLVPDGVFVPREDGVRFEALPPPTQGEVERLLRVVRHRVQRLLEKQAGSGAAMPLRSTRGVGAGAFVTSGGRPHRLADEAPAARRHHAPLLHRAGAGEEEAREEPQTAARQEGGQERTPRVDWAELLGRTLDLDVLACVRCGGRLKGVDVREGGGRGESDCGAAGPAHGRCEAGRGERAPQAEWC